METENSSIDLESCATEPIHIPGGIQPHGVLLVLDEPDFTIIQASNNTGELLGIKPELLLGQTLEWLFEGQQLTLLKSQLLSPKLSKVPHFLLKGQLKVNERQAVFDLIAHRYNGQTILELEPDNQALDLLPAEFFNDLLLKLHSAQTLVEFGQIACAEVRSITGFDQVMIYKFLEDGSGDVIAEDRSEFMPSYLGLRFPASDIPLQARQLYLTSRQRSIATARYHPAAMVPLNNPLTDQPLDMSYAVLRSVSPVHLEYMQNMGVASSQSISLVKNAALWGLIVCHHKTSHYLPFKIRRACEFLGQLVALQLAEIEAQEDLNYLVDLKVIPSAFLEFMNTETNFGKGLTNYSPNLLDFISAGGAAVYNQGELYRLGNTPTEPQLLMILKWLSQRVEEEIFQTDSLPTVFGPEANNFKDSACGLLAISITRQQSDYILFFRPEVEQTVHWSGDPALAKGFEPKDNRIHPRNSFNSWKQTVHLKSLPWKSYEVEAVSQLRRLILEVVVVRAEELGRLNAQLHLALLKEKELSKLRARLVTMASHEFRTPLTVILNSSELIENYYAKLSEEKRKEIFGRLKDQVVHITRMLDDTLKLDQVLEGELVFNPSYINLNQFCQDFCLEYPSIKGFKADRLTFAASAKPVWANIDIKLMRGVLDNLLSNALKFSRDEYQVTLELETRPLGQEVFLNIIDKGIGIPVEDWAYIFEPYHRGKNVEDGNIHGAGLGLTLAQKAVELHRGKITFVSEVNKGTTFTVSLPIQQSNLTQYP